MGEVCSICDPDQNEKVNQRLMNTDEERKYGPDGDADDQRETAVIMINNNHNDGKPEFRIVYFSGFRVAAIGLTAVLGGIAFEDELITFEECHNRRTAGSARWYDFPELNILDANGSTISTIAQSGACLRYVGQLYTYTHKVLHSLFQIVLNPSKAKTINETGKLAGFYPTSDALAAAKIDECIDAVEDVFVMLFNVLTTKDESAKQIDIDDIISSRLPYWMARFAARLEENEKRGSTNGYLVGDSMTVADIKLYCLCVSLDDTSALSFVPNEFYNRGDDDGRMAAFYAKMNSIKEIVAYIETSTQRSNDWRDGNGGEAQSSVISVPGKKMATN